MRGREAGSANLFSYVRLEERVPADHPLRPIRALADEVLVGLNARFESLYAGTGRPSIPPEMLLRASLLQAFFSVRSERMLIEQIDYNLLFRWFVGLEIDVERRAFRRPGRGILQSKWITGIRSTATCPPLTDRRGSSHSRSHRP